MSIAEFYKNREIFITGGTGFLGKSLLEKLLRDCPNISKIFMLIRSKKDKTPQDRLKEFTSNPVFERLHRERPNAFEKLVPIVGDSLKLGLGISNEDLERMRNVSIIFHNAANVRFDNHLRGSMLLNTRGTHELIKIALTLKNLIAFVHCSTAYINPKESHVEERMYDNPIDWRAAIKIAETYDEETLETLKLKYTNFFPNAYSFTKNISEQIIAAYSKKIPMVILRPSIVSHSVHEPESGFIDNLNGPMGLLVGIAMGVLQMCYCDGNLNLACIPVDFVTCLTIIACYKRGLETLKSNKTNYELDIRNLTSGELHPFTLKQGALKFIQIANKNPFQYTIWAPTAYMTTNNFLYMLTVLFISIPMAVMYDGLLILFKKQPTVFKITRKVVYASYAVEKFSRKHFHFYNDGMWDLLNYVSEDEMKIFGYVLAEKLNYHLTYESLVYGVKKYIFKEPTQSTPNTIQRFKVLNILDKIVKLLLFVVVIRYLWRLVN